MAVAIKQQIKAYMRKIFGRVGEEDVLLGCVGVVPRLIWMLGVGVLSFRSSAGLGTLRFTMVVLSRAVAALAGSMLQILLGLLAAC